MFKYFIVALFFLNLSCSKIEHATKTADEIKASAIDLKHATKRGLRKQKEAGSRVSMDVALDDMAEAPDVRQRLLRASIFFQSMPFQFVVADDEKRRQYYSTALSFFFTEAFPRFSSVRIPGIEYLWKDITEDYNVIEPMKVSPSEVSTFRELAALAIQMDRIADDQSEITQTPISFEKLCIQLIKTAHSMDKCEDCEYKNLPVHLKDNLKFADDATEYLQFAHNVLVYAALGQVFNKVSALDYFLYSIGQKNITFNGLIKETTNSDDFSLANERLDRARKIRKLFSHLGIPLHYSQLSYEIKLKKLLGFPKGTNISSSYINKDKRRLHNNYVRNLKETYKEYFSQKELQEQKGVK